MKGIELSNNEDIMKNGFLAKFNLDRLNTFAEETTSLSSKMFSFYSMANNTPTDSGLGRNPTKGRRKI